MVWISSWCLTKVILFSSHNLFSLKKWKQNKTGYLSYLELFLCFKVILM